jgi:hypothetical protein
MANLISTSSPELSATSISSPITQNNGTNPMIEYAGSVFISNGGPANHFIHHDMEHLIPIY